MRSHQPFVVVQFDSGQTVDMDSLDCSLTPLRCASQQPTAATLFTSPLPDRDRHPPAGRPILPAPRAFQLTVRLALDSPTTGCDPSPHVLASNVSHRPRTPSRLFSLAPICLPSPWPPWSPAADGRSSESVLFLGPPGVESPFHRLPSCPASSADRDHRTRLHLQHLPNATNCILAFRGQRGVLHSTTLSSLPVRLGVISTRVTRLTSSDQQSLLSRNLWRASCAGRNHRVMTDQYLLAAGHNVYGYHTMFFLLVLPHQRQPRRERRFSSGQSTGLRNVLHCL